jgi:suppressor of fused
MSAEGDEIAAPGWDAIDGALKPLYGDQEPKHFGTIISRTLGGNDPLQGISAYWRDQPVPHWHYVTYGFSELYEKESDNKDESGYGFELTMRVAMPQCTEEPPTWVLNFLQNLARYVFDSGNVFKVGDYMNANGPIAADEKTVLVAVAFVADPELPAMDTPNGRVTFLQAVGITNDEEFAIKTWASEKVMAIFARHMPLFVTDLARASLMNDAATKAKIVAGSKVDGAKTGHIFIDQLKFVETKRLMRSALLRVSIGARQVPELTTLLPLRLPFAKAFRMLGDQQSIRFEAGAENKFVVDADLVTIQLTAETVNEICATLKPVAGVVTFGGFPGFEIEVLQTHIRDQDGTVVETIG